LWLSLKGVQPEGCPNEVWRRERNWFYRKRRETTTQQVYLLFHAGEKTMGKRGSLVYQMQEALKGVFRPGRRRYHDKKYGRTGMIRGIETMQCMVAYTSQFAHFIQKHWSGVRYLEQVTPEMAQAFIADHIRRENSWGYLGRVIASIRKLDEACRKANIFPADRPPLLPYAGEKAVSGYHSDPRPLAYTDEQAEALITRIYQDDPTVARLLRAMWLTGLRVSEASYLRAQDIDLESGMITLIGNVTHTKGGRPRDVKVQESTRRFLATLRALGEQRPDGHIFTSRKSLPDRARQRVRKACGELGIPALGTHGFRKAFAVAEYQLNVAAGVRDTEALLNTSRQLGHNRARVTSESYVSADVRGLRQTKRHR
jgi:integrase